MADIDPVSLETEPYNPLHFSYEPLDPEEPEIRLLEISPGKQDEAIIGRLRRVSLENSGEYEALSYAWGEPSFTHPIWLNGAEFKITGNLWQALKHLRLEDRVLVLWVDAICVDQGNISERSRQVGIMGQIFRGCCRVYVWLGLPRYISTPLDETPETGASRSAEASKQRSWSVPQRWAEWEQTCTAELYSVDPFTLVRHFHANKHFTSLPGFTFSKTDSKPHFSYNKSFWKLFKAYAVAAETAWWSRLWCVQEIVLARSALLVYGPWRMDWKATQVSHANHRRHRDTCCADIEGFPYQYRHAREEELLVHEQTPDAQEILSSDFEKLLRLYAHRQCKDDRDKVYGFLGLTTAEIQVELAPDYKKDTVTVYMDATRAMYLQRPGSLRFLTGHRMRDQDSKLPSWVRDYAFLPEPWMVWCERRRLVMYEFYNAAGDTNTHVEFTADSQITLKGIHAGTVSKVGEVRQAEFVWFKSSVQGWLDILDLESTPSVESLQSPRYMAFWRTLIADAMLEPHWRWRRATPDDIEYCASRIAPHISSSSATAQHTESRLLETLFATTYGRALFTTVEGSLGLCYPGTVPGDEVWVLHGSNTPFVLRRLGDESAAGVPRFRLIGDAYLDGFMDGEVTKPSGSGLCNIVLE